MRENFCACPPEQARTALGCGRRPAPSAQVARRSEGGKEKSMCTSPFYLREYRFEVPCGQCLQCRINKRKEWSLRLLHQMSYMPNCVFLTLTYDDFNLLSPSLNKTEFQLFMKRLRKRHKVDIKYFACGEYGDKSYRKHFHAIIYGLPLKTFLEDSKSTHRFMKKGFVYHSLQLPYWSYGYAIITGVSEDTIGYVCGYVTKKLKGYKEKYAELGLTPPFQLQSQGLGKSYALDNEERLKRELFCFFKGQKTPVPRYYRKILDIDSSYFTDIIQKSKMKTLEQLRKKGKLQSSLEEYKFLYFNTPTLHHLLMRYQKDLTLKAKEALYSRDTL